MELVFIPAGEFIMGSEANNMDADRDETPSHIVFIDSFWMDKTEVTNAMYGQCISTGACAPPAQTKFHTMPEYSNHPVLGVSWEQASAYCHWAGRRLPTEAEWEKAARGTDGRRYPWGDTFDATKTNLSSNYPSPVGSFPQGSSPYGVMDMAGNVFEWTATWGDRGYVVRGGAWTKYYFRGRVSDRGTQLTPDFINYDIGFRCVR